MTAITVDTNNSRLAQLYRDDNKKDRIFKEIMQCEINSQLRETPIFKNAKVIQQAVEGNTALHIAMEMNDEEHIKALLDNGADFTIKNSKSHTAILQHIEEDKTHYRKTDYKTQDFYALHKYRGPISHRINLILSAHVKYDYPANPCSNNGISHFHAACMLNHVEAVEYFLDNGVSPNESVNANSDICPGYTPLHFAAKYSSVDVAKILVGKVNNVNMKDAKGLTPLDILTARSLEMTDLIRMKDESPNELLVVALNRNKCIMEMILKKISNSERIVLASPESQLNKNSFDTKLWIKIHKPFWQGYTPLQFSLYINVGIASDQAPKLEKVTSKKSVLSLEYVTAGCLFDKSKSSWRDIKFFNSPTTLEEFYEAVKNPHLFRDFMNRTENDVAMYLPRNSPEFPCCTPLHLAIIFSAKLDFDDILRNTFDFEFNHFTTSYNYVGVPRNAYVDVIKHLLELGADVTAPDKRDDTSLELAARLSGDRVVKLLLNSNTLVTSVHNSLSHLQIALLAGYDHAAETLVVRKIKDVNHKFSRDSSYHINVIDENKCYFDTPDQTILPFKETTTALHIACQAANVALVQRLLIRGADLYAKDQNGYTPIHLAIATRRERAKKLGDVLFSRGNVKECVSNSGLSHLHVACALNQLNAVEKMIQEGADVNVKASHGSKMKKIVLVNVTPLCVAVMCKCKEIVELLVERGADIFGCSKEILEQMQRYYPDLFYRVIEKLASKDNSANLTPLHVACWKLDFSGVEKRLFFDDANARFQLSDNGFWADFTPLHFVTMKRDIYDEDKITSIARLLIEWGADVTLKNSDGFTPLHQAFDYFCLQLPISRDKKRRETGILNMLDDMCGRKYYKGNYPSDPKEILDLLSSGHREISINPIDPRGISHFHIACICNRVDLVEKFLKNGVDVNRRIDDRSNISAGSSPLHLAARYKSSKTLDLLLKFGADINAKNRAGNTPLHEAANYWRCGNTFEGNAKNEEVVRKLVRAGSDVTAENLLGQTPLEILMETKVVTAETCKMILKKLPCVNLFNPINEVGLIGTAIKFKNNIFTLVMHPVYMAVINHPEKNKADPKGRTPVHNIVAMRSYTSLWMHVKTIPVEILTEAIKYLIRLGFEVDQQDSKGQTALHLAAKFFNAAGINALLCLGSDVNIVDKGGQTPLSRCFEELTPVFRTSDEASKHLSVFKNNCLNAFFEHIYKMKLAGLYINEANEEVYTELQKTRSVNADSREKFQNELKKLIGEEIGSSTLHFSCFFVKIEELVKAYENLNPRNRQDIDSVFKNIQKLRRKFPEFAGLLQMQYRYIRSKAALPQEANLSFVQRVQRFFGLGEFFNINRTSEDSQSLNVCDKLINVFNTIYGWFCDCFAQDKKQNYACSSV